MLGRPRIHRFQRHFRRITESACLLLIIRAVVLNKDVYE